MKSDGISSFLTGLLHLAYCCQVRSTCQNLIPCRGLDNIPLYKYNTCYLSVHLLTNTWVVSTFSLLWIVLLVNICVQVSAWVLAFHSMYKWRCWNWLFIYSEIVLVLGKSCKNSTQSLGIIPSSSFCNVLTHYKTTVQLSKLRNEPWYHSVV